MPRKPTPPPPAGQRMPGSGRRKETPNRVSVAAREFAATLVNDPQYQHRLRQDFITRRVHPSVEAMIWGPPGQADRSRGTISRREDERKARGRA